MKNAADNFAKAVKSTLSLIPKEQFKLYIPVAMDVLFLIFYGFFTSAIVEKIRANAQTLGALFAQNSGTFTQLYYEQGLQGALGQEIVSSINTQIVLLIALLGLVSFGLYALFQGVAWRLALNTINKMDINEYLKRFAIVNVAWFVLFSIYYAASFGFLLSDLVAGRTSPSAGSIVAYVFFLLLVYVASISYVLIQKHKPWVAIKESFKVAIFRVHYVVLPFAFILILFFFANIIFKVLPGFFAYLFALLVALPILTIGRILLGSVLKGRL